MKFEIRNNALEAYVIPPYAVVSVDKQGYGTDECWFFSRPKAERYIRLLQAAGSNPGSGRALKRGKSSGQLIRNLLRGGVIH